MLLITFVTLFLVEFTLEIVSSPTPSLPLSLRVLRVKRSARTDLSWTRNRPYGLVFVYSDDFNQYETSTILSAVQEIRSYSCIPINAYSYGTFSQSGGYTNPNFRNYVYISRNSYKGCTATIGMNGGMQKMNLDPVEGCTLIKGAVIHEMMHSLGYDHEQNRPDRDQFVNINFSNVIPGKEVEFKLKPYVRAVGPYDYSSIMQYGAYAFARSNAYPTITSKLAGYSVPQWSPRELSDVDKKKIRFITGCDGAF